MQNHPRLNDKQREAIPLLLKYKYVLLYGGARSGKTVIAIYHLIVRAMLFPDSLHLICRRYTVDVRASVWDITIPFMMRWFGLMRGEHYDSNEQEMEVKFANGSSIVCAGLDDKKRLDKILGREYATIYQNEASDQGYIIYLQLETRLSQKIDGCLVQHIVDLNPPGDGHWTYKLWFKLVEAQSMLPVKYPDKYAKLQMNPYDNKENLAEGYIEGSLETLTGDQRERFLNGNYQSGSELLVFKTRDANYYERSAFDAWIKGRASEVRFIGGLDVGYQDADAFAILAYIDGDTVTWVMYEYKAFRNELASLAEGIRRGLNYIAAEFPWFNNPQNIPIYSDTNTIRYGEEGNKKKNWGELKRIYGFNTIPAFKRDKDLHVEFLRSEYNAGNIKIPRGGQFADETTQIVWHKNPLDGTIEHIIDDDIYHPDIMFAIMYAVNFLLSYGNQALIKKLYKADIKHEPEIEAAASYERALRQNEEQEEVVAQMMGVLNQGFDS